MRIMASSFAVQTLIQTESGCNCNSKVYKVNFALHKKVCNSKMVVTLPTSLMPTYHSGDNSGNPDRSYSPPPGTSVSVPKSTIGTCYWDVNLILCLQLLLFI